MPPDPSSSLSIRFASRLVIDSISYSNALPPWRDNLDTDFVELERRIRKRIRVYLRKDQMPKQAPSVSVPKKSGGHKKWLLPSIADQIIIQAAVSALAPILDSVVDEKRVMSYRYNSDPNHVGLTSSQIS